LSPELEYFIYALKYGFTTYNWLALSALLLLPQLEWCSAEGVLQARSVALCTTLGIAASFSAAWFVDRTSFPRIAKRLGLSIYTFHIANVVVHILPCALVLYWEHAPLSAAHGVAAAISHAGWGAIKSRGTFVMDDVYISLPHETWYLLWSVGIVTEVAVAVLLTAEQSGLPTEQLGVVA
jgi:hypothetical protein